jgi:hypothetical protein
VTIWIGEIQWMIRHGLGYRRDPILKSLHHIETRDALLDLSDPANPREAEWPEAEFIVGNPPFLGNRLLRRGIGDVYVEQLWSVFDDRLPHSSDLCCYWHEKARAAIEARRARRAGLLATQGIRGQANRRVLERVLDSGTIFFARSDEPWVLAGASVHISFVGQGDRAEVAHELDGLSALAINADLTAGSDLTSARRLPENLGVAFMGTMKVGPFDIDATTAAAMLSDANPDGRSNADVVRPWVNGQDLTGSPRHKWIIDFPDEMPEREAALYQAPFAYVERYVRPFRQTVNAPCCRKRWWIQHRRRPEMSAALAGLHRYIATARVTKHRLFVWLDPRTVPDSAIIAIARGDDYTFGILQSRAHETWARSTGTQLREAESGSRYTPTTCFETFPFPDSTPEQRDRVGEAARRLVELRDGWLNPPGLDPAELAKRTLTHLYNQRPTWLANAHADLDAAVFAAYGWPTDLHDTDILERLLAVNLARAAGDRSL